MTSIMIPADDNEAYANVPIHERALLNVLSNFYKQLMSIYRRISVATSDPDDDITRLYFPRHEKKRLTVPKPTASSSGIESFSRHQTNKFPPLYRKAESQEKLPMQDFTEITSALCDIHMILTHLVGIEVTQDIGLRCQAEALEGFAFQGVNRLADLAPLVDNETVAHKDFLDFHDLLQLVSKIFLRDGSDAKSQERRRTLLANLRSGCDDLAQTLEGLSMETKAVEDKPAMEGI